MPEGGHDWSSGEGVCNLIDHAKVAAYIRDGLRRGEGHDVVGKLLGRFGASAGYSKAKEIQLLLTKYELLRVEDAATSGAFVKECTDTEKVVTDTFIPDETIIHAALVVREVSDNVREPLGISISSRNEALRRGSVSIPAPLSQKCGEMTVTWVD